MAYQPVAVHLQEPAKLQDPMELRKLRQTQLLNRAWNESLVTEADPNDPNARIGDVDQRKFYENAKALGLDPDSAAASLAWRQKQYAGVSGMSDIADTMAAKRPGFDIEQAVGRAGAGYGQPAVIDNTPAQSAPAGTAGTAGPAPVTEQSKPQAPMLPQGVAVPPSEQSQAPAAAPAAPRTGWDGVSDYLGIGRKPEQMLAAQGYAAPQPQAQPQTDIPRPAGVPDMATMVAPMPDISDADMQAYRDQVVVPPDRRTFDEAAMDKYMSLPFGGVQTQGAQAPASERAKDPVFAWAPQDDGSNAYRQYATALDSQLKANGFASAPDYLMSVYDSTYPQFVKPVPPAALMATPEGKIKYQAMMAEHQQSKVEADARARQAVLAERKALTDAAKQYGTTIIDDLKTQTGDVSDQILLDPTQRNAYNALRGVQRVAPHIEKQLQEATDWVAIQTTLPAIVRLSVAATNPGQQVNEGAILENSQRLASKMGFELNGSNAPAFVASLVAAFRGDGKPLTQMLSGLASSTPDMIKARGLALIREANDLATSSIPRYATRRPFGNNQPAATNPTDEWFAGVQAESRAKKQPAADTAAAPAPAPAPEAQPKPKPKPKAVPPKKPNPAPKPPNFGPGTVRKATLEDFL